jgi:hypothetical protein
MVAGLGAGGEGGVRALASAQRRCGVAMEDGPGTRPEIKATQDPVTKVPEPTLPTPTPATTLVISVAEIPEGIPEYDRTEWKHWVDEDRDCQDARQEALIEGSLVEVAFEIERECRVATGRWWAPHLAHHLGNSFTSAMLRDSMWIAANFDHATLHRAGFALAK